MASGSRSGSNHCPRHSTENYQSQRPVRTVSWNQVVRGESNLSTSSISSPSAMTMITVPFAEESSSSSSGGLLAPPLGTASSSTVPAVDLEDCNSAGETSEDRDTMNDGSAGNVDKKSVWNKPSSGSPTEIEPIMSWMRNWPALSESTKSSTKSSSSSIELLAKHCSDGSSVSEPVSLGTGSLPFSSHTQVGDNTNINHVVTTRHKPVKRSDPVNGSYLQQSPPTGNAATVSLHNSSPKEHLARSGQMHNVNDHPQHRNSFRSRNGGSHQRGDSSHHNYGGRREHDRGNQELNTHRNFSERDSHLQPQGGPRFVRSPPPPNSGLFIPPHVRPFGGPMALPVLYVAAPPLESLRGVPLLGTMLPHQVFVPPPPPDPLLHGKIVGQIDYYFSNDNLIKDIFLRRNMDDQGWVPADLIARFNKVMQLTDNVLNVPLILEALKTSSILEVQGDKVRRRNDWHRWIMPSNVQFSNAAGPKLNGMSKDEVLAGQVQRITLETPTNQNSPQNLVNFQAETFKGQTSYGDLNNQLHLSGGEGSGRVAIQAGSDQTILARN